MKIRYLADGQERATFLDVGGQATLAARRTERSAIAWPVPQPIADDAKLGILIDWHRLWTLERPKPASPTPHGV